MLKIISVVNQKGGCSKTTTAINLALNLHYEDKRICLLDADPQQSVLETLKNRKNNIITCAPALGDLVDEIEKYKDYDYVIVDTPPHNDEIVKNAVLCSGLVIIPVRDSPLDLRSAEKTVELIREAKKTNSHTKSAFLISNVSPNTRLYKQVKGYLRSEFKDIPIFNTIIHTREIYRQALIYGEAVTEAAPSHVASNEVNAFTYEVIKMVNNKK